jgi:hypothetical protein
LSSSETLLQLYVMDEGKYFLIRESKTAEVGGLICASVLLLALEVDLVLLIDELFH